MSEESKAMKSALIEELKAAGLDVGEEVAVAAVKGVFKAVERLIEMSANKYDDMLLPVIKLAEPKVMELLDKIDKEDDPGR